MSADDSLGRLSERIDWLTDRAEVQDLLIENARCIDERDWAGLAALYAENGRLVLPYDEVPASEIAQSSSEHLRRYLSTVHLSANYSISIEGDIARARSNFIAVHVLSEDTYEHSDVGGVYRAQLRRTASQGWKYVEQKVEFKWKAGREAPDEAP